MGISWGKTVRQLSVGLLSIAMLIFLIKTAKFLNMVTSTSKIPLILLANEHGISRVALSVSNGYVGSLGERKPYTLTFFNAQFGHTVGSELRLSDVSEKIISLKLDNIESVNVLLEKLMQVKTDMLNDNLDQQINSFPTFVSC